MTDTLLRSLDLARCGDAGPAVLAELRGLGYVDSDGLPTSAGMRELRRLRRGPCTLSPVSRAELDLYADRAELWRWRMARICKDFHARRCRGSAASNTAQG